MKNKIRTLLAVAVIAAGCLLSSSSQAQTPPPGLPPLPPLPTSQAGIFETVTTWASSFDTNMTTFTLNRASLWTGASSLQNGPVNLVNDIGGSYDFFRNVSSNSASIFFVGADLNERNSGVAGTLVSIQGGATAGLILYDLRIGLYADAGDYVIPVAKDQSKLFGEVGFRASKALGQHFATGLGFAVQIPNGGQVFSVFGNATF